MTVHAGNIVCASYWFHAVEKHDDGAAISVNVFSASIEADVHSAMTTSPSSV